MKDKIFYDTVHGNIRISEVYCKKIIDTLLFQRLRRIEQSSVRSLYPCARHDRFIHSIGVFHIGSRMVDWLQQNTKSKLDVWNIIEKCWQTVTKSYRLACLLHDVGHAPFSHTFEHYYDYKRSDSLDNLLTKTILSDTFAQDLKVSCDAKPHEKISAYLLATQFKDAVEEIGGKVEHAVRMIIGCNYTNDATIECQLANCFITVLHGEVDADRLDYAVRDQWAAGFSSGRIDIERLLRSMVLVQDSKFGDKLRICFTKGAINTIEGLTQIKDFQRKWVFRHHNVIYDQHILSSALETATDILKTKDLISYEEVLKYIFNINIFESKDYSLKDGLCLYLLSDDTIIQILRKTINKNPFAEEWLSRQYKKKPLWKTPTEYNSLFSHSKGIISKEKINALLTRLQFKEEEYILKEVEYKPYAIPENQVWFWINEDTIDASNVISNPLNKIETIFYLYINADKIEEKNKIIKAMKEMA